MSFQDWINGQLHADMFLTDVVAFIALMVIVLQIFATIVSIRVLFFIWRSLGFLETSVQEASQKQRGLWLPISQKELDDFHQSQAIRWRAAIGGIYVVLLGSIVVAAFFADRQPAAWLVLFIMVALLVLIGIVIAFN